MTSSIELHTYFEKQASYSARCHCTCYAVKDPQKGGGGSHTTDFATNPFVIIALLAERLDLHLEQLGFFKNEKELLQQHTGKGARRRRYPRP